MRYMLFAAFMATVLIACKNTAQPIGDMPEVGEYLSENFPEPYFKGITIRSIGDDDYKVTFFEGGLEEGQKPCTIKGTGKKSSYGIRMGLEGQKLPLDVILRKMDSSLSVGLKGPEDPKDYFTFCNSDRTPSDSYRKLDFTIPVDSVVYCCTSDTKVVATYYEEVVSVRLIVKTDTVADFWAIKVPSGSGARYVGAKYVFWNKGHTARIEKDGETVFAVCTDDADENYMSGSVDDARAASIAKFLREDYAKEDIAFMSENERKFQLYQIDLNADGNNETFVRLFGNNYCGTGGCTFLLLDKNNKLLTTFTATRPPFWVGKTARNGWRTLMVKYQGEFKELVHSKKGYPTNPSVVEPTDLSPSGHDEILFDDGDYPAKTYWYW